LISIALLAASREEAWWGLRVWNSNDTEPYPLGCNQYVSLILTQGACSESSFGGTSTSTCTSFTDSTAWDNADNFLNDPSEAGNTQNANLSSAASEYQTINQLIATALAFCVFNAVLQFVSALLIPVDYHKKVQVVGAVTVGLSILLILGGLSKSSNDMTDVTYLELVACFAKLPNTTLANSSASAPITGFFLALVAMLFQIADLSFMLMPGTFCFCCPSSCCACIEHKDEGAMKESLVETPANYA
jgi:hypothetical protein